VKGEGPTDWAAVKQALAAARRLLDAPPGVGERMREALAALVSATSDCGYDCRQGDVMKALKLAEAVLGGTKNA
jgi:hypothetical protein